MTLAGSGIETPQRQHAVRRPQAVILPTLVQPASADSDSRLLPLGCACIALHLTYQRGQAGLSSRGKPKSFSDGSRFRIFIAIFLPCAYADTLLGRPRRYSGAVKAQVGFHSAEAYHALCPLA